MADWKKILGESHTGGDDDGTHWLSVSDLMAGLMMIFLFIAIALMFNAYKERDRVKEIAVAYQENQVSIYEALMETFKDDLERWDASIDKNTLAFDFKSPDVLFPVGKTTLRPEFQEILDDFFPRYLETLLRFSTSINEVRIEGHTSSDWQGRNAEYAYFMNMELSQGRTRSVLGYVYGLDTVSQHREWIKTHFAAVGFSSSKLIRDSAGIEDETRSRRVSFRVITNAETQIKKILEDAEVASGN